MKISIVANDNPCIHVFSSKLHQNYMYKVKIIQYLLRITVELFKDGFLDYTGPGHIADRN